MRDKVKSDWEQRLRAVNAPEPHPSFSEELDLKTINIEIPDNLTLLEWGPTSILRPELLLAAAIQWYRRG